jgi:CRP-like cAMP-binding protein
MVSVQDLGKITLLADVPIPALAALAPFVRLLDFQKGDVIFEEGAKAEEFYMLKRGKVLLEVDVSDSIIVSLGSVKSGQTLGWSALIEGGIHSSYAICAEQSEVIAIPGQRFLQILTEDTAVGFLVMSRIFQIFSRRLERRTGQFLKVMRKHPDIQRLLGE